MDLFFDYRYLNIYYRILLSYLDDLFIKTKTNFYFRRMIVENDSGENPTKVNKYACACAIVASMISIIFGYGKFHSSLLQIVLLSFFDVRNIVSWLI